MNEVTFNLWPTERRTARAHLSWNGSVGVLCGRACASEADQVMSAVFRVVSGSTSFECGRRRSSYYMLAARRNPEAPSATLPQPRHEEPRACGVRAVGVDPLVVADVLRDPLLALIRRRSRATRRCGRKTPTGGGGRRSVFGFGTRVDRHARAARRRCPARRSCYREAPWCASGALDEVDRSIGTNLGLVGLHRHANSTELRPSTSGS